ncbi:DUF4258 domain-containing protein [uncultured Tolumonas sp.]|uniref:DUF4258 domain-containing protein n=1 Tax=uncultured Tolumonas sp. TaxID=263765 RepID=UPI002A0A3D3F|nr:DUF4258 domain-containing protein [uncultured Tolumonas sp.]
MTSKPTVISEFPLTDHSAKQIIRDLAENHTGRIKFSKHIRERMIERRVTDAQILSVLKSHSSVITESTSQTPAGDWKLNMKGVAAGDVIEVVICIQSCDYDPSLRLITVMIK